jgi:hypothetical protein
MFGFYLAITDQTDRDRPLQQMRRKEKLGGFESNLSVQTGGHLGIVGCTLKSEHLHFYACALQLTAMIVECSNGTTPSSVPWMNR